MRLTHRSLTGAIVLIAIFASSIPFGRSMANGTSSNAASKNTTEFQVDIPVVSGGERSKEELVKSELLNKQMIKMGRAKSQGCTRCHGRAGVQALANSDGWEGSIAEFVVMQLTAFRDGKRSHEIMTSIAKPLSDQDIVLIALWYQSVSKY